MLSFLPGPIRGALSFLFVATNTVVLCCILFVVTFLKIVIPIPVWRKLTSRILIEISTFWIDVNNAIMKLMLKVKWVFNRPDDLDMNQWYIVVSNHQTWVDIPVLQKTFQRKIPFLKFFIKQELIWVPFLGLTWWALDYPFMKRYSPEFLAKNPHLKGKDLETTKKACEKFKTIPVSIMNFVEGTRFSAAKRDKTQSPYTHLLKPKAAGTAFVLAAMGGQIARILDVTIVYPGGAKSMWDFFCGRVAEVRVDVKSIPVAQELQGDYFGDEKFRAGFQNWLNDFWAAKDAGIKEMLKS